MATRRLVVEIVGDASSLERSFAKSSAASRTWGRSISSSTGATIGLSRAARNAEHDVGRASRGFLAGSGTVSHLGRALAFASGSFLAFAGASSAFRAAIDGAESLQKATDSLSVVIRRANGDVAKAVPLLDKWAKAQQRLGVSQTDALVGLRTTAVLTGSVQKGMLAYTMGLELSRAENISMSSAMRISAKALLGQTTSLTRYGIILPKTANSQKIFNAFQERFASQAETNTSAFDRLRAASANLATSVGQVLLPTFEKYARSLTGWISKSENQRRVISAVKATVSVLAETFGALFRAGTVLFRGLEKLKNLFGSWKPVIVGVTAALVALGLVNPWLALGAGAVYVISHWKQVETFFANLGRQIANSFKYVWYQLERGALKAALAVVEPFSHLPGFLGGWARKAKNSMQAQLSRLHPPNMNWGGTAARDGALTGRAWRQAFDEQIKKNQAALQQQALNLPPLPFDFWQRQHPGGTRADYERYVKAFKASEQLAKDSLRRQHPRQRTTSPFGTDSPTTPSSSSTAAAAAVQKGFVLPFKLQLAEARASATRTLADDLRVAREVRAFVLKMIPRLHGQKLLDAYNALAQANATIASDVKQATKKATRVARTVAFSVPAQLGLNLARDEALGRDTRKDLLKIRAAILKFIRTHKHNIAALTDAWNQLASINQQLGQTAQTAVGLFKQASTKALTAGLGLTAEERRRLRARLSQLGPGGTVPSSGIGAAGFAIDPHTGRPLVVHTHVHLGPKEIANSTTRVNQRKRRRNSRQRRGPHAGLAYGD